MTLLYAKVGGPPAHWASLTIKKDGVVCSGGQYVVEVDILGCWAVLEELWQGNVIQTKVYGNWTIEEPPDDKTAADCKAKYPDNVRFPKGPTIIDDQNDPGDSDPPGDYYYNDPSNI